ncbi:hypothetical protein K491DRAFT_215693 [Lophiostoma macrostomum CBS 122681]|uniref:Uncharacterized protein n=1 Tax=Lophiostoma macrostomum CBS 122681 TaxID=1314788 RepID=A0A6A6TJI1_9PLEO|nr:hypothetical protein K491DRAFT_215693 [Lophiostoma macrostomum CBS 122681]
MPRSALYVVYSGIGASPSNVCSCSNHAANMSSILQEPVSGQAGRTSYTIMRCHKPCPPHKRRPTLACGQGFRGFRPGQSQRGYLHLTLHPRPARRPSLQHAIGGVSTTPWPLRKPRVLFLSSHIRPASGSVAARVAVPHTLTKLSTTDPSIACRGPARCPHSVLAYVLASAALSIPLGPLVEAARDVNCTSSSSAHSPS